MKAIQISEIGAPDVLQVRDIEQPQPASGQVLIHVRAIGVNFIDVYFREGRYKSALPFIPGQEGAGVVVELGDGVHNVKIGDRVAWCGVQGAYAQFVAVPSARLVRIPEAIDYNEAAAALLQGMTAHYLTHSTHPIKQGDTALVHAGAGGVGLLLTQIAKMLGARVIATVSTPEKAALSLAAGADHVIEYTHEDFVEETRLITGGRGVDVVYDSVGKTTFDGSLKCLRPRGLLALFGGSSGAVPPLDLIKLSTMGSLFITRPTLAHYMATHGELEWRAGDIFRWVEAKRLKLRIEHIYPLAEAARAHRDLESRKTTGKLILVP